MRRFGRIMRFLAWGAVGLGLLIALVGLWDWRCDRRAVAEAIEGAVRTGGAPSERMRDAVAFLRDRVGYERSDAYYRLPVLRFLKPTARQVLRDGGDCAYRARACIVILDIVDVDARKIALFDGDDAVHAAAVVETENGPYVVDLLFNVIYENESGMPIPLDDLARPEIHRAALDRAAAAGNDRVVRYPARYHYRNVHSIDWDRHVVTRGMRAVLRFFLGEERVAAFPRPYAIEEPALLVAIGGGALAGGGAIVLLFGAWRRRRARRRAAPG